MIALFVTRLSGQGDHGWGWSSLLFDHDNK